MKQLLAVVLLLLATPSAAAESSARDELAQSMLALLGGESTGAGSCSPTAAICTHQQRLEALRQAEPSLIRGDVRVLANDRAPHLLAVARRLPEGNRAPFIDTIILFNTSLKPLEATVMIDRRIDVAKSLLGRCPMPSAGGLFAVRLAPFETLVCAGAVAVN